MGSESNRGRGGLGIIVSDIFTCTFSEWRGEGEDQSSWRLPSVDSLMEPLKVCMWGRSTGGGCMLM